MVTRGFTGRQSGSELSHRIPPGQHLVDNFPVLTAGPTPRIDPADWTFHAEGRTSSDQSVELV